MDVLALLMNIDKLIPIFVLLTGCRSFGSLMNIDKLILNFAFSHRSGGFGSMMNIDKLIRITLP